MFSRPVPLLGFLEKWTDKKKPFLQLKRVSSDLDNLHECRSRQRDAIEVKERHLAESAERERQSASAAAGWAYKT